MMSNQTPKPTLKASRCLIHLAMLVAIGFLGSLEVHAVSPCTIGLPIGSTPSSIDGRRLAEWDDAGLLISGDPCLDLMGDRLGTGSTSQIVKVYSKQYSNKVGFFFEIPDTTQSGPDTGGRLHNGDRIVLQFDSDMSRGAQLGGGSPGSQTTDFQIVITYKGRDGSGGVFDLQKQFFVRDDSFCPNIWSEVTLTANVPNVSVRSDQLTTVQGYSAEIEIPKALLGTPTSDFGFAFAVVNDVGDTASCATDVCEAYAISFPDSVAITSAANPVTPGCAWGDWVVPNTWGTAVFSLAPGMVTVSRSPDYWSNTGLLVYKCASHSGPNYEYFNSPPCTATLEARIRNNTGSPQRRNILFLWSPVGASNPSNYNFIQLKEHVDLPVLSGTATTSVFTDEWNVPSNAMAHPCVRVFILPENFVTTFPRPRVVALTRNNTDVSDMMTAYSLTSGQWTQKNITQITARPNCDAGCNSTGAIDPRELKRTDGRVQLAAAQPVELPWQPTRTSLATEEQRLPIRLARTDIETAGESARPAPQKGPDDQLPPIVSQPGRNIRMAAEEFERFSRDNVIVQVRAVGYNKSASTAKPRYNILENLGGVITLVPISILRQSGSVPFQFNVTNGDTEHTIFLVVDVSIPASVSQTQVALDTQRIVYAPNENRVARGVVILPGVGPGGFKRWGLSFHAGVSIPHGNFGDVFNPGPNAAVDLEYRINRRFSLEGIYGIHHFRGGTFGPLTIAGTNVHQFSVNGKVYGSTSPVRPFFNFGGGGYKFESDDKLYGGLNIGGGVQLDVTSTVAVEAVYNFHNVFTSGSQTRFSGVQGGVRFRF